ncbi:rod shape-determining protein MreD [Haliangium sp.]|uniref:rod shape-determining protein MreD n=1 Tax=Haliangium sp. TaxID=2663208 RepID=UPI003D1279AA
MRVAAQVLLAYLLLLILGAVWRFLPLDRTVPDLVALWAVYLGLTARQRLAPATAGAVIIGYLADLLLGTPRGAQALAAGIVCVFGHLIHRRLIVRGPVRSMILGAAAGVGAGVVGLLLRAQAGHLPDASGEYLAVLGRVALVTGICGPVVFRLCRMVDARFARTHREREAAREGLHL